MIKRFIGLVRENRRNQKEILKYSKELNWVNVYHDSIRGFTFLNNINLNIGRWAGNYAFFYVLNRILTDYSPSSILELGLGESTRFISAFLCNDKLPNSKHLVIEEDENWFNNFSKRISLSKMTEIMIKTTETTSVGNIHTNVYSNFNDILLQKFDLYIIDGPKGSTNLSRYDMVKIVENFSTEDEFIFLIDDYERAGERESVEKAKDILSSKNIVIYETVYYGLKNVLLLATGKYKNTRSF